MFKFLLTSNPLSLTPVALVLLSILDVAGCRSLHEEEFVKPEPQAVRTYTVTLPTSGWRSIEVEGTDIAMEHEVSLVTFAIFTPSRMKKTLPLGVLSTQLLLDIKDKKIISREYITLARQSAMRTLLEGKVEGEEVKIESYILTKDELVYDIICWGRPEEFQVHHEDFRRVVESFRFIEPAL